ncbi:gamma-parvin [Platysternon megacephalum]|uniref:Gamma-parvin n=1 Tax=Platysternon megacephalum TaxID=55544 RepID=A0A4D9EF42_9SAUR|nr:gamma-parvin [Platysternon megacephalum]
MWQPATERLQHFQTMLKTKLNVLTLRKEPLPTVIFHEPEAIELCTTTPLMKTRAHTGCKQFCRPMQWAGQWPYTQAEFHGRIPSSSCVTLLPKVRSQRSSNICFSV